jgi:hypothetical protein
MSLIVRGFLSVLLSVLMSGDGWDRDAFKAGVAWIQAIVSSNSKPCLDTIQHFIIVRVSYAPQTNTVSHTLLVVMVQHTCLIRSEEN